MAEYKLYCLCLNNHGKQIGDIFSIKITSAEEVSDLQKAIKATAAHLTQHLDAFQLSLWKLSKPVLSGAQMAVKTERDRKIKEIDFPDPASDEAFKGNGSVQFLDPCETLSDYWEKPPERKLLHILVCVPPPEAKKCPPWLVAIRRKIWKSHECFDKIFRTANLTKRDFGDLQDLLDGDNPGRNSDLYVPGNVLDRKADFLRKRSKPLKIDFGHGLVPRLFDVTQADDKKDGVVDDDNTAMDVDSNHNNADSHMDHLSNEAEEIFPYTIRYVDLTDLDLEINIRVPLLMLFRNEWATMIDIFNWKTRLKGRPGSAIITGHPGIGKTCLVYAILILCMIRGQQLVFQDDKADVYVIDETGVNTLEEWKVFDHEVLALVDADGDQCKPAPHLLHNSQCRMLLTSSPRNPSDRIWLKQYGYIFAVYTMELWSRKEFVVATLFLHNIDITLKQLQRVSDICGNIPRSCYQPTEFCATLLDAEGMIKDAIQEIKLSSYTSLYAPDRGETTHRLFQVRPGTNSRSWVHRLVQPVSAWAFKEMLKELPNRYMDEAYKLYCGIQGPPDATTLRGRIFETYLHRYMEESPTFTIKALDGSSATLLIDTTPGASFRVFDCLSDCLASCVKSNRPWYLKPQSPVFPSFDSFLYLPGISGFSPLIALQVTTASTHGIKITGLEKVQDALKSQDPRIKNLQPTNTKKMIILFVVPKASEGALEKQKITGKGQVGDWNAKTTQYIVAFSEKDLFNVYRTGS